jgi:signal transduction histidine kinase
LYANAAARALKAGKSDVGADHIQQIIQLALEAMVDMRSLIFELRPPDLEKVGLATALQSRLQAVEGRAGVSVEFHSAGNDGLPLVVQTELYRIAQEALTNVVKHANAKHVAVDLNFGTECTALEIRDDGKGFDLETAQQKNTMGLRSLAERAQKIHGVLTVSGEPGRGTTVRVEIPNG